MSSLDSSDVPAVENNYGNPGVPVDNDNNNNHANDDTPQTDHHDDILNKLDDLKFADDDDDDDDDTVALPDLNMLPESHNDEESDEMNAIARPSIAVPSSAPSVSGFHNSSDMDDGRISTAAPSISFRQSGPIITSLTTQPHSPSAVAGQIEEHSNEPLDVAETDGNDEDEDDDDADDEEDESESESDDAYGENKAYVDDDKTSSGSFDPRLLDPNIDPTILHPNLSPFAVPTNDNQFSFDKRILPVNLYDSYGTQRYTSGLHLPDCGEEDPIGVNLSVPQDTSSVYSAGATISVPEYTDVNLYSILKGHKRFPVPYPWWEPSRATKNVSIISRKRKSLFDEYVFCHIYCHNLQSITKVGQVFSPFVCIQRERTTRNGPSIWDTIASTEAIPFELLSRRNRDERIRSLAQFLSIHHSKIPESLAQCSPDFPLFVIPAKTLTDGDPTKCIRLLVQHRDENKARNCAAVVVTVQQLRNLSTRNTEKLYSMFANGEDLNQFSPFDKDISNYLKLKLVGSRSELSDALTTSGKEKTIAEQRLEASKSPSMYINLFQPLFDITPSVALTPLYKPVPLVARQSLLYVQFCTNGFISGLRNSGKRRLLSAGYLIFRTFHRTKTNPNHIVDYTRADRDRLSQEYHDAVLRNMTEKQQRKYREILQKIESLSVTGGDVDDDLKSGLLLNYRRELEQEALKHHQQQQGFSGVAPSNTTASQFDNDADHEDAMGIIASQSELHPTLSSVEQQTMEKRELPRLPSMLTDSFINDSFAKASFQEVTLYTTPVANATGNLSWSFALPVATLTGGTFDFDQQIKVVLMDALNKTKREVGFTVITLRELINQGTTPWNIYKEAGTAPKTRAEKKMEEAREAAGERGDGSEKYIITTPPNTQSAPAKQQHQERSKLADEQAKKLAKINKLTANIVTEKPRHKSNRSDKSNADDVDGVDSGPDNSSAPDSGRSSAAGRTSVAGRGRERSRVRNRERSRSGVRNREPSRSGIRSKREASRIYSRMDNEDAEFASKFDEVAQSNLSVVRPRSVSRNRHYDDEHVNETTPRHENYIPPTGYFNTSRTDATPEDIVNYSYRPNLNLVGSIICTGARLFSSIYHIEDAARRDFYFQVKSHAKCCTERHHTEPSAYPVTPAYPEGLFINDSRKDKNIVYPFLHDNPLDGSSYLIKEKRPIRWMEQDGISCHLAIPDGAGETTTSGATASTTATATGETTASPEASGNPPTTAEGGAPHDVVITDIQSTKPCLWWEDDINHIPEGLSALDIANNYLFSVDAVGTKCICPLGSYFDLLLDADYQRTKQLGTMETKSALDIYRTLRNGRVSAADGKSFAKQPSVQSPSSLNDKGEDGRRRSLSSIKAAPPPSPSRRGKDNAQADAREDEEQHTSLPSILHAFISYLCTPRDLEFPHPPPKVRKRQDSSSALIVDKSESALATPPVQRNKSTAADSHFLSLNTTFADWIKNRRYDQYTSWKFQCVNVPKSGFYELEIYVWRQGQYELLKVSPQVKAEKNGEILQVSFDPFVIRGMLMIENDKLRSATKPPPPPQHPRLTLYLTRRRKRRERRYLKLLNRGDHTRELAKVDIYAKINTEYISQQIDLGLTPDRVYLDVLDEDDSDDDMIDESAPPSAGENQLNDDEFWTQDPQEQLGSVMGSPIYSVYNRMLLSVSRPLGRGIFKSGRKLPLLGPAYTGVMKEEDAKSSSLTEINVPLAAFPPELPKDLTDEELKHEFVDPFEDMRTEHDCGRPAAIIAINTRFARLRQGVEHLGFVEVMFEDLREQAAYQRIKLEEKIKEARKIGSTSSLHSKDAKSRKERKDFEKRSKAWLFDTKLDLGRIDVKNIDHKDLALPLMNAYGKLQFPSIEITHVGLSSQQQKKSEQALEKLAKEARAIQRAKEKEQFQAMIGEDETTGIGVTRAKTVPGAKPSKK